MRRINRDSLPHIVHCVVDMVARRWYTNWARVVACWWGVSLGSGCLFRGHPWFRRHPESQITIGLGCRFNSSTGSNPIGVNRPCMISTNKKGAQVIIGSGCGFSGTVICCASKIMIGENVRCGANTLITDADWHTDDPRAGEDAPVLIGNDVWLGVNVTVLKGVTIGENTFVGANSVVSRSLPAGVVASGFPARPLKDIKSVID